MLGAANYAFRAHYLDYGTAGDRAAAAFALDILSDSAVRSASQHADTPGKKGQRAADFITLDELIALIERRAADGSLPRTWHVALPASLATRDNFVAWLRRWFSTIESNAVGRFRKESMWTAGVVSALAVVCLNLDAIQLASDLFHQTALSNTLAQHAPGLLRLADSDLPEAGTRPDGVGDFVQISGLLNVPELRLGWQRSVFIEHFCAWRETCSLPVSLTKTVLHTHWSDVSLYGLRWAGGLTLSFMLLLLGAPFWADRLREVLQLRGPKARLGKEEAPP
jgi:hypothetical protein